MTEQQYDAATESAAATPPAAPRWVKILAVVVLVLAAVLVVAKLAGAGAGHGPGMHGGAGPLPAGDLVGARVAFSG